MEKAGSDDLLDEQFNWINGSRGKGVTHQTKGPKRKGSGVLEVVLISRVGCSWK